MFKLFNPDLMNESKILNDKVADILKANEEMIKNADKIPQWKYQVPKNTPTKPLLNTEDWEITQKLEKVGNSIDQINATIAGIAGGIGTVVNYITHPILIWSGLYGTFYIIALVVGGVCIILATLGIKQKKAVTGALGSILGFAVVKVINIAIGG